MKIVELRRAPVVEPLAPEVSRLVADPAHDVAWTGDAPVAKQLIAAGEVALAQPAASLQTASLSTMIGLPLTPAERELVTHTWRLVADRLKHEYAPSGVAIDGIELILATRGAVNAWTDQGKSSTFKIALKTSEAIVALAKALKPLIPFHSTEQWLGVAGFLIKVGNKVEHVTFDAPTG